jgi:hypothetical protein
MSEQMVYLAAAQHIIVKFLTNKNVKHAEILSTVQWQNALKDPGVCLE